MKTNLYLFWGYAVVWLGLAGYLFHLARRLTRARAQLGRLERPDSAPPSRAQNTSTSS